MTEDPLFGSSIHEGERTTLRWSGELDDWPALIRWLGPVEELDLEHCRPPLPEVVSCRLRGLRLAHAGVEAEGALLIARRCPQLERLSLAGNDLGPQGVRNLGGLESLVHLELAPANYQGSWGPDALAALIASSPALGSLALGTNAFTGLGGPARLTRLDLTPSRYDPLSEETARKLARSPAASQLHELVYRNRKLSDGGLQALISIPRLRRLRAAYNDLTDASALLLARGGWEVLDLRGNAITPEGAHALAQLASLRELRLEGPRLGDPALTLPPELTFLELRSKHLSDASLQKLARQDVALNHLELDGAFTDAGLEALLAAPWFSRLQRVTLRGLGVLGLALAECDLPALESLEIALSPDSQLSPGRMLNRMPSLRRLSVYNWPQGPSEDGPARLERLRVWENAANLERTSQLRHLRVLELSGARLADLPLLPELEVLELENTGLDNEGARLLAQWPNRLKRLDLRRNQIGWGAQALADSPNFARLETLDMRGNPLRETDDIWYDQGFEVGCTPADPAALALRKRFGRRLKL